MSHQRRKEDELRMMKLKALQNWYWLLFDDCCCRPGVEVERIIHSPIPLLLLLCLSEFSPPPSVILRPAEGGASNKSELNPNGELSHSALLALFTWCEESPRSSLQLNIFLSNFQDIILGVVKGGVMCTWPEVVYLWGTFGSFLLAVGH